MKHLVISAVNLVEAGTLEILRHSLLAAARLDGWRTTAIVHSVECAGVEGITYIERPDVKSSWLKRIRFEYADCKELAVKLQPDFWLSMHDMTPDLGVLAGRVPQAVYCHNAMCFYHMTAREMLLEPKLIPFSLFYSAFYRINLRRNAAVVVQQEWLRNEFRDHFGYRGKIIVAHPQRDVSATRAKIRQGRRFFYPSYPRVFKNFELLLEAWHILTREPSWDGQLTVTLDGSVNRYAQSLFRRFGSMQGINFIGKVSRDVVKSHYASTDCLVFPSKLETWGMPITEAKENGLFILASDLPYAREAIGTYDGASFFDPQDALALAEKLRAFRDGQLTDTNWNRRPPTAPFVPDWDRFYRELLI